MAYIANTAFELKVTNHEFDSTENITGIYGAVVTDAETGQPRFVVGPNFVCPAGTLCQRYGLRQNEGYPTGVNNGNTWEMYEYPGEANLSTPIYACNPFDVNTIKDPVTGNEYKVGPNTLGLPLPAGKLGTFTRIDFLPGDRHYRFGIGNVKGTLGNNGFLTVGIEGNAGMLVPAATAPATAGSVYFKVLGTGTFTEGAYNGFGYVDVEAHAVIA